MLVKKLHGKDLLKIKPTLLYALRHQVLQDIHINEHKQTVGQTVIQIYRQTPSYLQCKYDRMIDICTCK